MSVPRMLHTLPVRCRPRGSAIDTRRPGQKMVDDCLILLEWACKNGDRCVSLAVLEEETGIPDATIRVMLNDAVKYGVHSKLYAVASCYGFVYRVAPSLNKDERYRSRKSKAIIDAVRWAERETNYD